MCRYVNLFLLVLLAGISGAVPASAQRENDVWAFGFRAGLDFSAGQPVPVTTSVGYGNREASASVCDDQGRLLFYTDGSRIWNRNHVLMPNAHSLHGLSAIYGDVTESTYQGALIVPAVNSDSLYYVFSLTCQDLYDHATPYAGRLFYSVVDMSLDNGLGDVVPGRKWIALDFNLAEKMIAIPGAGCNIWVMVHDRDTNMFKAYEVNAAGVATRSVRSYSGVHGSLRSTGVSNPASRINTWHGTGQMTASPDGTLIGYGNTHPSYAELHDFDALTGVVSNGRILDTILPSLGSRSTHAGICFSADNSKVYVSGVWDGQPVGNHYFLCQFDLNAPGGIAGIRATKTMLGETFISRPLRLGPDGKIYMSGLDADALSVVDNPEIAGAGCGHRVNAISLAASTLSGFGLGNTVVKALPTDTLHIVRDTFFCAGEVLQIRVDAPYGLVWEDGGTDPVRHIADPGIYRAEYDRIRGCRREISEFRVEEIDPSFSLGNDTVLCAGELLRLDMGHLTGALLWNGDFTGAVFEAGKPGQITLQLDREGCVYTDSLYLGIVDLNVELGGDTVVCHRGQGVSVSLEVPEGAAVVWNDGSSGPVRQIRDEGVYAVQVIYGRCRSDDTLQVRTEICDCEPYFPDAFTPNGDGRNDLFRIIAEPGCPLGNFSMYIFNRWGEKVYGSGDYSSGWDGIYRGAPAEPGTYMFLAEFTTGTGMYPRKIRGDVILLR